MVNSVSKWKASKLNTNNSPKYTLRNSDNLMH